MASVFEYESSPARGIGHGYGSILGRSSVTLQPALAPPLVALHILGIRRVDIRLLPLENCMTSSISTEPAICLLFICHIFGTILNELAILIFTELNLEPVDCHSRCLTPVGESQGIGAKA